MARSITLFEAATGKGRVLRQGEIVQVIMDGAGAFVCAATDFMVAQRWAMTRPGSGNTVTDRGRFIEKIEVLVSRPNSFVSTRGSSVPVERLAKAMKQAGYNLKEWNISREVIIAVETGPVQPKKKLDAPVPSDPATDSPALPPSANNS